MHAGATGALANLGGDVRVAGESPLPPAWRIGASHPLDDGAIATFAVNDGAVVTTTRTRRRWTSDGVEKHHLIDPQTGQPSASPLASVTVIASHGVWAEVLAKAAFVAGPDEGAEIITRFGATGLLIDDTGTVTYLPGVGAYLQ
jgi:thiamine biosynthesis lipoprotein